MKRFDKFTATRGEYWAAWLAMGLIAVMIGAAADGSSPVGTAIVLGITVASFIAVTVARIRDAGLNGWLAVLVLVPFGLGQIATIYFGCIRSDDDPKKRGRVELSIAP